MSASKVSTRPKKITVRLSEPEHQQLKALASQAGLKMEPFLRRLIAGKEIRARPTAETVKLMQEVSRIGSNVNQIARVANSLAFLSPEDIRAVMDMQKRIWNKIKDL